MFTGFCQVRVESFWNYCTSDWNTQHRRDVMLTVLFAAPLQHKRNRPTPGNIQEFLMNIGSYQRVYLSIARSVNAFFKSIVQCAFFGHQKLGVIFIIQKSIKPMLSCLPRYNSSFSWYSLLWSRLVDRVVHQLKKNTMPQPEESIENIARDRLFAVIITFFVVSGVGKYW